MDLTKEQQDIIENTIKNKEGTFGILAAAGSGKSFTIFKAIDYIKEHEPNAKILYIVFNKANQEEAEFKLRKYQMWLQPVKVYTAHSFAREKYLKVRKKLEVISTFDSSIIYEHQKKSYFKSIKSSKHSPFKWLLNKYCTSRLPIDAFCENMEEHFDDFYDGPDKPTNCTIFDKFGKEVDVFGIKVDAYAAVTKNHVRVFKDIFKEHEKRGLYTHGMYLKAAAYCKTLPSEDFDYVFFDEAQDASYFMLKVLEKMNAKRIYFVGDERQSIYDFDGANINVFYSKEFDKTYTLSKSFRFGKAIADLANSIISLHSNWIIEGTEQDSNVDYHKCTRLYRTNAKLFKDSLELAYKAVRAGVRLKLDFLKASDDDYNQNDMLCFLCLFYKYVKPKIYNSIKHIFENLQMSTILLQFKAKLEEEHGHFYKVYNMFYDILCEDLHQILYYAKENDDFLEKYNAYLKCKRELFPEYEITMITMHRSKGLEWDNVIIAENIKLFYECKDGSIRKNPDIIHELNLAYVAITRARKSLDASIFKKDLCMLDSSFNMKSFIIKSGEHMIDKDVDSVEDVVEYEDLIDEMSAHKNNEYLIKQ